MSHNWIVRTIRGDETKEEKVSINTIKKRVLESKYLAHDEVKQENEKEWKRLRQLANTFDLEKMIYKGVALFNHYLREEAIKQFRNIIAFKDSVATAWLLLAVLIEDEDPVEAAMAYDKCIAHNYKESIASNNKGVLMVRLNEADAAIDCFNKSAKFAPDLAAPHYNLGMIYRHLYRTELRKDKDYKTEYNEEFKLAYELDGKIQDNIPDPWGNHRANFLYESDISKAFGITPDRDKLNREKADKYKREAGDCIEKGQWDKALDKYSLAVKHNTNLKFFVDEGIQKATEEKKRGNYKELDTYLENEQFDKATEIMREIIKLGVPNETILDDVRIASAKYFFAIGLMYKKDEKYEDARKNLRQAAVCHQNYQKEVDDHISDIEKRILSIKVEEYRNKGEYERAISSAEEILFLGDFWHEETERLIDVLKKEKAELLFNEGKVAIDKNEYLLAEKKFSQSKEFHESLSELVSQKINYLNIIKTNDIVNQANRSLAEEKFDEILSLADEHPDNWELQMVKEKANILKLTKLRERAEESEKRGEYNLLIQIYKEILSLEPKSKDVQARLNKVNEATVEHLCLKGEQQLGKKEWDLAKKSFEEALNINSECGKALQGKNDAEFKLENSGESSDNMDKARRAYIKGKKHLDKGDYDKADEEFKKALDIRPDYAIAIEVKNISFEKKIGSLFLKARLLECENSEESLQIIEEILRLTQGEHEPSTQLRERINTQKKVREHLSKAAKFEEKESLINAIKEYHKAFQYITDDEIVKGKIERCVKRLYDFNIEKHLRKGKMEDVTGLLRDVADLSPAYLNQLKQDLFKKANKLVDERRFSEALNYLDSLPKLQDFSTDIKEIKQKISSHLSLLEKIKLKIR